MGFCWSKLFVEQKKRMFYLNYPYLYFKQATANDYNLFYFNESLMKKPYLIFKLSCKNQKFSLSENDINCCSYLPSVITNMIESKYRHVLYTTEELLDFMVNDKNIKNKLISHMCDGKNNGLKEANERFAKTLKFN